MNSGIQPEGSGTGYTPALPNETAAALPSDAGARVSSRLPDDLTFAAVMAGDLKLPRAQPGSWLDIIRESDRAAAVELLLDVCKLAPAQTIVRWAGGCKGFGPEDVERLFEFVAHGSISADGQRVFQGASGSGGTMDFNKDGAESVMICQVPYYQARLFPCIAWGSTPQTFRLRLDEDTGSVIVSKYGAHLDHRGHMNILTQTDATTFQDWNGDVRWYIEALGSFAKRDYAVAVGLVNGGDVTMDEALLALSKGVPVIAVEGTGRAADELVSAYQNGGLPELYHRAFRERSTLDAERDEIPTPEEISKRLHIVQLNNPASLSREMDALGLLTA